MNDKRQRQQQQKQRQQQQRPQKEQIDVAQLLAWLQETGLYHHPLVRKRIELAIKTGNVSLVMDFIRSNPHLVERVKFARAMEALKAQADPFYPRPVAEEFKPGVPVAEVKDQMTGATQSIFTLTAADLLRHVSIFGSIGGGKTNAVLVLCSVIRQLFGDRARIWIFEPKDRYRDYLFPDFDVLEFRDFRDESFEPPTDKIPLWKWYDQTTQFFSSEQFFLAGGKNALNMVLYWTLGWERLKFPTHELVLKLVNRFLSKAESFKEKEVFTTVKLRLSSIVNFDKYTRDVRIPISDLMNRNIIFEWSDETMEMLSHRTALLLNKLYMYKKHERSDLINIIIFEEARRHLAPRSGPFGESVLETIATLAREMMIGLVFVTQEPSSIAKVFKSNVSTTIAFPLSEGEEMLAVKRTMNLNQAQFDFYTKMSVLGEGNALVNYRGVNRPFPVYFPFVGDPEGKADPQAIKDAKERLLSRYEKPKTMPLFDDIPKDFAPWDEDDDKAKKKPDPKPKKEDPVPDPTALSAEATAILKTLYENPFFNTTELMNATDFKANTFQTYRNELVDKGYVKRIKDIRVKKVGSSPLFLDLTDLAYQRFGWKKPSWGRRSLAHRLYQQMVSDYMRKKGWATEIEALTNVEGSEHRFDVLAWKDSVYIDFEITLSMKNLFDNMTYGFSDDRIGKMVFVCRDEDVEICWERVRIEYDVYEDKLDVLPISKFFK